MTKMEDIKQAVRQLSQVELAQLRDWLEELQADQWDEQIERDIKAGKLDTLGEKWRADHAAGRHSDCLPTSRKRGA